MTNLPDCSIHLPYGQSKEQSLYSYHYCQGAHHSNILTVQKDQGYLFPLMLYCMPVDNTMQHHVHQDQFVEFRDMWECYPDFQATTHK